MKIKKITVKNFQPFADQEQSIDLDTQSITLITGFNSITGSSNGSGKCVAKGTKIITKEFGEIEIQELFDDCEVGDLILPEKGELHVKTDEGWNEVEMLWITEPEDLYELKLEDGKELIASSDHRIMTERGWVKLKNLRDDDEIIVDM